MKISSTSRFLSRRVVQHLVMPALICLSLNFLGNTAAKAQDPIEKGGIIIGSIIVNVAEPDPRSSALRGGRKLEKVTWGLVISKSKGVTLSNRQIKVKTGDEKHFLEELRGGSYRFVRLVAQGFANFYFPLHIRFDVTPKVTTYVGRLEVTVPYRLTEGPATVRVADSQEQTLEALKGDNAQFLTDVRKGLMSIER